MSHFADIESTFKNFQSRYGWTPEETGENFLSIITCLEWELNYKRPPEIWDEDRQRMVRDYAKEEELELDAAIKRFR